MKIKLPVLFVIFLIATSTVSAQSKKDLEAEYAKCQASQDSLSGLLTTLTASHEAVKQTSDSLSKVCAVYDTMYQVIKEKVFNYNYDPANIGAMIDSLGATRESAFSNLNTTLSDSIAVLNTENGKLKEIIATLSEDKDESADVVNDLKQLKELLDAGILTQEEFDAKKALLLEKL